jgi:hypothetical protein
MTDPALALNPAPLYEADVYAACRAFVLAYALPAMQAQNVFQGWQNRAALPAGSEDYAVISIISASRRGTGLETFSAPDPDPAAPGILKIEALFKVAARIEFCAEGDRARRRAQRCAALARSGPGVGFFNGRGLSCLYADEVREHSFRGEAQQFVRRYATILHLSLWSGLSLEVPYFDKASLSRLEDVDVHHKP